MDYSWSVCHFCKRIGETSWVLTQVWISCLDLDRVPSSMVRPIPHPTVSVTRQTPQTSSRPIFLLLTVFPSRNRRISHITPGSALATHTPTSTTTTTHRSSTSAPSVICWEVTTPSLGPYRGPSRDAMTRVVQPNTPRWSAGRTSSCPGEEATISAILRSSSLFKVESECTAWKRQHRYAIDRYLLTYRLHCLYCWPNH